MCVEVNKYSVPWGKYIVPILKGEVDVVSITMI